VSDEEWLISLLLGKLFSFLFSIFFFSPSRALVRATCQYPRDKTEWHEGPGNCSALETSLLLNNHTYELLGA